MRAKRRKFDIHEFRVSGDSGKPDAQLHRIEDMSSGQFAVYKDAPLPRAEHKQGDDEIKAPTSVRKLHKSEPDGDSTWPNTIAVKSFKSSSTVLEEKLESTAATYRQWYGFSGLAKSKGKWQLLIPWLGEQNLLQYINGIKPEDKLSTKQLLLIFYRLLLKVSEFHQRHNRGIGDIKPENLIPALDSKNKLCDLNPIDITGSTDGVSYPYSEPYITLQDVIAIAGNNGRGVDYTAASDFRALSVVLSLLSHHCTLSNDISYRIVRVSTADKDKTGAIEYTYISPIIKKRKLPTSTESIGVQTLRWLVKQLHNGINPLLSSDNQMHRFAMQCDIDQLTDAATRIHTMHKKQQQLLQTMPRGLLYSQSVLRLKSRLLIMKKCNEQLRLAQETLTALPKHAHLINLKEIRSGLIRMDSRLSGMALMSEQIPACKSCLSDEDLEIKADFNSSASLARPHSVAA